MNAFIVINIVECCAQVSHHECVGGENGSRNGGRSIDWEKGADCRELAADFFFLDIGEASNMFDHLFMGKSHLVTGGAVWRRRGDDVGGIASAVDGGRRTGWNKDGGR